MYLEAVNVKNVNGECVGARFQPGKRIVDARHYVSEEKEEIWIPSQSKRRA